MPTRFRRSLKLAPGIRLNIGKTGITSVSVGGSGLRQTFGTSGRRRTSVGVPGTGFSVFRTTTGRGPASSARQQDASPFVAPPSKPGLLAKPVERRFYEGLEAYRRGEMDKARTAFQQASSASPQHPSPYLFGALIAVQQHDYPAATALLEWVVQNAQLPDDLMAKYAAGAAVSIPLTARLAVDAPLSAAPPLLLAESYQELGRREEAIGLMQQLHETSPGDAAVRLSLAELLFEDGDDEGVVELAAGTENESDVALALLHLKAKALIRAGMVDAGLSELTACLKKTKGRDAELLREIRYDRALSYAAAGKMAKSRAELEKLYAEDPSYRDVRDRLRAS